MGKVIQGALPGCMRDLFGRHASQPHCRQGSASAECIMSRPMPQLPQPRMQLQARCSSAAAAGNAGAPDLASMRHAWRHDPCRACAMRIVVLAAAEGYRTFVQRCSPMLAVLTEGAGRRPPLLSPAFQAQGGGGGA